MAVFTRSSVFLHRTVSKLTLLRVVRLASSTATLQDIRQQLLQYESGSVELTKNSDTGIAVLTLSNPGKKNALSGSMMVELADHVAALSQWKEGKGLIVTGADNTFCSGGDLTTVAAIFNPHDGERMSLFMHDTLTRLHALPLVSMALLQGVALGGGAEIATACDFRAMTPGAKVGFVQVKMGVTTGWGGATRLFNLLGRRATLYLLCSGKLLDAESAHSLGFADHVLHSDDKDASLEEAKVLQDQYCRSDAQLVRGMKRMITKIESSQSLADALEHERTIFASFWGGELHKAAVEKNIKHS